MTDIMKTLLRFALPIIIGTTVLVGCGDSSGPDGDTGTLKVVMTDAPFPIDMVAEANVSIERIEMRSKDTADGEDFITLTDIDTTLNLVDLRNGLTATLAEIEVPVGEYDLVRVIIGDATIKLVDGREFELKVPSGQTSGIKVFVSPMIDVEGGLTTELLLDFDLSSSFVVQGNPSTPAGINGFNFKPVIRAVNVSTAGRVEGTVTDTLDQPIENVYIALKGDEVDEIYEAYTEADGDYALLGVPAGTYTLEIAMEGYQTVTLTGVVITAANKTEKDVELRVE